ncbi:MAG TPA: hypothetical protein PLR08_01170 [bacterium]|nr:hypothetical protein [bacterium]
MQIELGLTTEKNTNFAYELENYSNDHDYWVCYCGLEHDPPEELSARLKQAEHYLHRLTTLLLELRPVLIQTTLKLNESTPIRENDGDLSEETERFQQSVRRLRDQIPHLKKAQDELKKALELRATEEQHTPQFG